MKLGFFAKTCLLSLLILGGAMGSISQAAEAGSGTYVVNADDILNISVLQPDQLSNDFTVSPDGSITFPYIGNVDVKGATLIEVQDKIQKGLSDYMKYPVVAVSLKESHSRIFYVYGEVNRPGSYPVQDNLTVMRAISMAGGFTRIASYNAKILRASNAGVDNEIIDLNLNDVMTGKAKDIKVEPGDMITASKSIF